MNSIRLLFKMIQVIEILRDKEFNIAKNPKYDGYQTRIACLVYKCFDKKSSGSGVNMHANNKIKQNRQLNEELQNLEKEQFIQE